jgi:hypothetical protein
MAFSLRGSSSPENVISISLTLYLYAKQVDSQFGQIHIDVEQQHLPLPLANQHHERKQHAYS